jgi:hypothetical protein
VKRTGTWVVILILLAAAALTGLTLELVLQKRFDVINDRVRAALTDFVSKTRLAVAPDGTPRVAGPSDPVRARFVLTSAVVTSGEGVSGTWYLTTTPEDGDMDLVKWELLVHVTQSRKFLLWTTEVELVDVKTIEARLGFLQPLLENALKAQGLSYEIAQVIH